MPSNKECELFLRELRFLSYDTSLTGSHKIKLIKNNKKRNKCNNFKSLVYCFVVKL